MSGELNKTKATLVDREKSFMQVTDGSAEESVNAPDPFILTLLFLLFLTLLFNLTLLFKLCFFSVSEWLSFVCQHARLFESDLE